MFIYITSVLAWTEARTEVT